MAELNKLSSGYWALYFPALPVSDILGRDFVLNIYGTGIPSVGMTPIEKRWQAMKIKMPDAPMMYDDWTFNFIVDEKLLNWQTLYNWLIFINNNKDKFISQFPKYCVSPTLHIVDNFSDTVLKLRYVNAWPIRLGEVNLNTRSDETVLECQCTFTYDRFEYETYEG